MSAPLYLVQMRLDPAALMRFAAGQRLDLNRDEDGGYALHAWLAAMFGSEAPKPFRWFEAKGELLGYSRVEQRALIEHAEAFATPAAHAVLLPETLHSKVMPDRWAPGRRLAIQVAACPISRSGKTEKDVYLREQDDRGDSARTRETVYIDWFRRQWGDALVFERVALTGFNRIRAMRRGQSQTGRVARSLERPRALFDAVAEVRNGELFMEYLARGIGRHRAFGFGMVLLAPPP